MYWRSQLSTASPVQAVLDRESYTLEDLLEEENLIQETKSLDSRLITFLCKKETVAQLVSYLVDPSPDEGSAKYTFLVCEVLCCEIDAIFTTLLGDGGELFKRLLAFIDTDEPPPPVQAGYFSKAVSCLLARRAPECVELMKQYDGIVDRLVQHVGITSIAEVLLRLVGIEEHTGGAAADTTMEWLCELPLLDKLVDTLAPGQPASVHTNAADVLVGAARSTPSPLAAKLGSPALVARLFRQGLAEGGPLPDVLEVAITIADPKRATSNTFQQGFVNDSLEGLRPTYVPPSEETTLACAAQLEPLVAFLSLEGDHTEQPTTYGALRPPLGLRRLKVVDFVATLLRTQHDAVAAEFIRLDILATSWDLFATFPFNNVLHHLVEQMACTTLEWGHAGLVEHTFGEKCDLIGRLVGMPVSVANVPGKAKMRAGYMGHVIRLGNKLAEVGGGIAAVGDRLWGDERWAGWVEGDLREMTEIANVTKWACGRPAGMDMTGAESDPEDDFSRDFDISPLPSNLSSDVYHRYGSFDGDVGDDDEEDTFFDDEDGDAAEMMNSLDIGDKFSGEVGSSSDEEDGGVVAPAGVDNDDTDAVLLISSDEEDGDVEFESSPQRDAGAAAVAAPAPMLRPTTPAASVRPGTPAVSVLAGRDAATPMMPSADAADDAADASFNTYNFWKPANAFQFDIEE